MFEAFSVLARTRKVDGMTGPQPIGVLEIDAYARLRGLDGDDAEELLELVLALDAQYLERVAESREKSREQRAATDRDAEA